MANTEEPQPHDSQNRIIEPLDCWPTIVIGDWQGRVTSRPTSWRKRMKHWNCRFGEINEKITREEYTLDWHNLKYFLLCFYICECEEWDLLVTRCTVCFQHYHPNAYSAKLSLLLWPIFSLVSILSLSTSFSPLNSQLISITSYLTTNPVVYFIPVASLPG